jgi:hypothetical protein
MQYHFSLVKTSLPRFTHRFLSLIIALFFVSMFFAFSPDAFAQQVQLAWNADAGAVAGYNVYWGTSTGVYGTPQNVGNVTTATLPNMSSPTYYIAVAAYNSSGSQGSYSPELVIYSLTSSAGTGGSISPSGSFFQSKGASQTFTITPSSGYSISSVTGCGGTLSGSTYTTGAITSSCTVTAAFAATTNTYTITSSVTGSNGTISPTGSVQAASGGTKQFTITPNAGYTASVGGSCGGALSGNTYTTNPITANCTVTASFSIDPYTVTPSAGSGGTLSPSTAQTVNYNSTTSFTVTPNTGYSISSVTGCGGTLSGSTYTTGPITSNCTVAAAFTTSTYTITSSATSSNGTIAPSGSVQVAGGGNKQFTITPNAGYTASVGGSCGGTLSGNIYTTSPITANCTVSASFAIDPYTVTPSAGTGGTLTPSTAQTVNYNKTTSFTVTPNTGYSISSVTGCGGTLSGSTYTTGAITGNCTVTAAFTTTSTFTITSSVTGSNGTISPSGSVPAGSGSTKTFTVMPSSGYTAFVGGSCGGNLSGNIYTTKPITANCTVIAAFIANTYTITASAGTGGSISPSGTQTVKYQGTQTFAISPAAGYRIAGVSVDGASVGGVTSYMFSNVTANHTISASFQTAGAQGPVADAGPDQDVKSGSLVTLDGLNSTDSVSGIASYKWTQTYGPQVSLSSPSAAKCTFTAPNTASGTVLLFNLVVTNKAGVTGSAYCFVNVSTTDIAPLANAGGNQTVYPYTIVSLNGSGSSDPYGTIASYLWVQTQGPTVQIVSANSPNASFTAPNSGSLGVSLVFSLLVTDNLGLTTRDQCTVNVVIADKPPVAKAGPDQTAATGASVKLDGSGSTDPANSPDSYRWKQISGVPVTLSNPTAISPTFTVPNVTGAQSDELVFMLTVTNAANQLSSTAKCVVTVKNQ